MLGKYIGERSPSVDSSVEFLSFISHLRPVRYLDEAAFEMLFVDERTYGVQVVARLYQVCLAQIGVLWDPGCGEGVRKAPSGPFNTFVHTVLNYKPDVFDEKVEDIALAKVSRRR